MPSFTEWGQPGEEWVCGGKYRSHFVFLEGTQELCGCCICDWAQRGARDRQRQFRRPQQDMASRRLGKDEIP